MNKGSMEDEEDKKIEMKETDRGRSGRIGTIEVEIS